MDQYPMHLGELQIPEARSEDVDKCIADLRTGMRIRFASPDATMAQIYAAVGMRALHPDILSSCFVRHGQEPQWGSGVRLEIEFNRRILVYSLRRRRPSQPLYLSIEVYTVNTRSTVEVFRVTIKSNGRLELKNRSKRTFRFSPREVEVELVERIARLVMLLQKATPTNRPARNPSNDFQMLPNYLYH